MAKPEIQKNYLYISKSKVDWLFGQIPEQQLSTISAEFDINFAIFSAKLKDNVQKPIARDETIQKLQAVISSLEKTKQVGTVEAPKQYFKGEMEMAWSPFFHFDDSVFFSGETADTILGLGGAARHFRGVQAEGTGNKLDSFSFAPVMLNRIQKVLSTEENEDDLLKITGSQQPLRILYQIRGMIKRKIETGEWWVQRVGFVAEKLLLDDLELKGEEHKTILLGSPLYVEACG